MRPLQPPRDRVSQAAGAGAAILLLAGLGYEFAGPAIRMAEQPLAEVWVTIIHPSVPAARTQSRVPAAPRPR